jgi:hypothetical protein
MRGYTFQLALRLSDLEYSQPMYMADKTQIIHRQTECDHCTEEKPTARLYVANTRKFTTPFTHNQKRDENLQRKNTNGTTQANIAGDIVFVHNGAQVV